MDVVRWKNTQLSTAFTLKGFNKARPFKKMKKGGFAAKQHTRAHEVT